MELSYTFTFTEAGNYIFTADATADGRSVHDTVTVCSSSEPDIAARPTGTECGVNYDPEDPTRATLLFFAKDKNGVTPENVYVLGDFNEWSYSSEYQMKKDSETGYFWLLLTGLEPGTEYAYQYTVKTHDKTVIVSDPYAEKVLDGWNDNYLTEEYPNLKPFPAQATTGLAAVLQTGREEFVWSDATLDFRKPDKDNLVIYELWIHDFSAGRTIRDVTARLDYLSQLGINAIELMPITEFDGNISWGYNPNHYFAPDKAYGTADDYKTFIDECHKRGIAVLLDMVFNQSTGSHPFAALYWDSANNRTAENNPWYNVTAPHPYSVFHDFNHEYNGTREHFNRVMRFWIDEYHIDGYRMDLTKGLTNKSTTESTASGYDASRIAIIKGYYDAARQSDPNVIFIIEHFCDTREEQELVDYGIMPWRNLNNSFSQTAMGWLTDGDDLSGANKSGWVSYAESHDEERNFYKAKAFGKENIKNDETVRLSRVPLNAAFCLMAKGPKMLWQFGELGYDFSITDNGSDRTDPKPVPEILGWYKTSLRIEQYIKVAQMLQLKARHSDLFLNGTCTAPASSGVAARLIRWQNGEDRMVIAGNFSATDDAYLSPFHVTGTWFEYFSGEELSVSSTSQQITLRPGELRIYTPSPEELPAIDIDDLPADITVTHMPQDGITVWPTLSDGIIYITPAEHVENVTLYTLGGVCAMQCGHTEGSIDISHLPVGLYLMAVRTATNEYAFKIYRR